MRQQLTMFALMTLAASGAAAAPLIVSDFSFENYSVGSGNFQYSNNPSFVANYIAGWTFSPGTGITASGSAFQPPTPVDGNQAGILQGNGSSISQFIGGFDSSFIYTLDIWVGTRYGGGCCDGNAGVTFLIDGVQIGTTGVLPSSTPFTEYLVPFTVATSGAHSLELVNLSNPGDHTAFVDNVAISSQNSPEPATCAMIGGALVALGALRRRRK